MNSDPWQRYKRDMAIPILYVLVQVAMAQTTLPLQTEFVGYVTQSMNGLWTLCILPEVMRKFACPLVNQTFVQFNLTQLLHTTSQTFNRSNQNLSTISFNVFKQRSVSLCLYIGNNLQSYTDCA